MDIDDILNVGVDIMNTVSDAVKNKDYSNLSQNIKQKSSPVISNKASTNTPIKNRAEQNLQSQRRMSYSASLRMPSYKTPFLSRKISRNAGLGSMIGGIFGMCLGIPLSATTLIAALTFNSPVLYVEFGLSAIFTAGMMFLTRKGRKHRRLANLYNDYGRLIGTREYIKFEELSSMSGRRTDIVIKDIKKMISLNMLPQAYIDESETILMLTPSIYKQYQIAQKNHMELIAENERKANDLENSDIPYETKLLIKECDNYLNMVRRNNELIESDLMSEKLSRLEAIMDKTFLQVRNNPSSLSNMRKFLNYYLPTTEKLLSAYIEVDKHPIAGQNIKKTKAEIESAMDTINEAFENLFDSLFEETAWDISSDISVMKTMMAQDGLTEKQKL